MSCVSSKSTDKKAKKGKNPFKKKSKKEMGAALTDEIKREMDDAGASTSQEGKPTLEADQKLDVLETGTDKKLDDGVTDKVDNDVDKEQEGNQLEQNEEAEVVKEDNNKKEKDGKVTIGTESSEDIGKAVSTEIDAVEGISEGRAEANSNNDNQTVLENSGVSEKVMEADVKEGATEQVIGDSTDQAKVDIKEQVKTETMEVSKQKPEHKEEVKSPVVEFTIIEESGDSGYVIIDEPGESNDDPNNEKPNYVNSSDVFTDLVDAHALSVALKSHYDMYESDMEVTSELFLQFLVKGQRTQLKSTVRKAGWSVTDEIRKMLWKKMCAHIHKSDSSDIYSEYDETLFGGEMSENIRVPSFVDIQNMSNYHLTTDGILTARKILSVLEMSNPDIVYCPMLFPVVCLFLHFMDASQCYNCVYALLRSPAFLSQTKVSFEASKLVVRDLAKKHAKSAYTFLVRNANSVDAVFDTWMWWVLQDLPFQYLVRVFDCYLLEGVKVLYRVVLSILIHFYKLYGKRPALLKSDESSSQAAVLLIRKFCREMPLSLDKLLKTGFSIRGLKRKDIQKLQVKHEMFITSQRHLINMPLSRSFSGPIVLQNLSSDVLTADMLLAIWTWLPTRYAVCQPELLYTSDEHGISLVTLYQRVENHQPTLIVIKTTTDEIFGAFCSTCWKERRSQSSNHMSYFGTGETFLFTLSPEKKKYQWVGLSGENIPNTANMFQAGDRSILTIGGGHGEAIYLDENLEHCRTEKCDTFNNEPLSQNEDFMCKVVEVYGFQ